jgi:hypothetical protein
MPVKVCVLHMAMLYWPVVSSNDSGKKRISLSPYICIYYRFILDIEIEANIEKC